MKSSKRDEAEGKMHRVKSKIKEIAGKVILDSDLEAEGKKESKTGKVQEKIGDIKKVLVNKHRLPTEAIGGIEDALDHMCYSFDSVGRRVVDRVHDGWRHSCPGDHRHHRGGDPDYSRSTRVTICGITG